MDALVLKRGKDAAFAAQFLGPLVQSSLGEPASEADKDVGRFEDGRPLDWAMFLCIFVALAIFDFFILAPSPEKDQKEALPQGIAIFHIVFWFLIGLLYNVLVFIDDGPDAGLIWFDGYILEYLLSVDNVFFFHVIFTAYATPEDQRYKGLFYGIIGAITLRGIFFFLGLGVFRIAWFVQLFFGAMLVYSGYKTIFSEEEEQDPKDTCCVKIITKFLPISELYAEDGALFTRDLPGNPEDQAMVAEGDGESQSQTGSGGGASEEEPSQEPRSFTVEALEEEVEVSQQGGSAHAAAADVPMSAPGPITGTGPLRGTLLLLVIVVLQVVDLMFAVDSVTAKLAESDSVYLDFTSSAFAMLCLRSMYFVMEALLKHFRFLQYGVGLILALIGVKLIVGHWIEFPPLLTLSVVVLTFSVTMVLSRVIPPPEEEEGGEVETSPNGPTAEMVQVANTS